MRLGELVVRAYHALDGHVSEPGYDDELRDVAAKEAAGCEVVVAVDDHGRLVGGVTFVPGIPNAYAEFDDPDAAGFRHLAVDPVLQGLGAGRVLVGWCVERATRLGRRRVIIHSTPWMTRAHRLYERAGFRRAPELDWRPAPEVPLLGFVKEV